MELLECPLCLFLMCEPVSMSCGHTFCRRCVCGGYLPAKCPACKERLKPREARAMKNNVLLIGVVEKCCPEEARTKCQILEKLKHGRFEEALRVANEGLQLCKTDLPPTFTFSFPEEARKGKLDMHFVIDSRIPGLLLHFVPAVSSNSVVSIMWTRGEENNVFSPLFTAYS